MKPNVWLSLFLFFSFSGYGQNPSVEMVFHLEGKAIGKVPVRQDYWALGRNDKFVASIELAQEPYQIFVHLIPYSFETSVPERLAVQEPREGWVPFYLAVSRGTEKRLSLEHENLRFSVPVSFPPQRVRIERMAVCLGQKRVKEFAPLPARDEQRLLSHADWVCPEETKLQDGAVLFFLHPYSFAIQEEPMEIGEYTPWEFYRAAFENKGPPLSLRWRGMSFQHVADRAPRKTTSLEALAVSWQEQELFRAEGVPEEGSPLDRLLRSDCVSERFVRKNRVEFVLRPYSFQGPAQENLQVRTPSGGWLDFYLHRVQGKASSLGLSWESFDFDLPVNLLFPSRHPIRAFDGVAVHLGNEKTPVANFPSLAGISLEDRAFLSDAYWKNSRGRIDQQKLVFSLKPFHFVDAQGERYRLLEPPCGWFLAYRSWWKNYRNDQSFSLSLLHPSHAGTEFVRSYTIRMFPSESPMPVFEAPIAFLSGKESPETLFYLCRWKEEQPRVHVPELIPLKYENDRLFLHREKDRVPLTGQEVFVMRKNGAGFFLDLSEKFQKRASAYELVPTLRLPEIERRIPAAIPVYGLRPETEVFLKHVFPASSGYLLEEWEARMTGRETELSLFPCDVRYVTQIRYQLADGPEKIDKVPYPWNHKEWEGWWNNYVIQLPHSPKILLILDASYYEGAQEEERIMEWSRIKRCCVRLHNRSSEVVFAFARGSVLQRIDISSLQEMRLVDASFQTPQKHDPLVDCLNNLKNECAARQIILVRSRFNGYLPDQASLTFGEIALDVYDEKKLLEWCNALK